MNDSTQKGFSLAEMLVALLIFSAISAASVYVLRLSVDARDQLGVVDRDLALMETARSVIKDDLAQTTLRPVRDEFGSPAGPAFRDGNTGAVAANRNGEKILLAFVRGGWSNPDWAAPRSSLQYVEYVAVDDTLVRRSRPYLDDARGQPRTERVLLDGLEDIEVEFLAGETNGRFDWTQSWPVQPAAASSPPRAVAMTTRAKRFGEIRQLFWIGDVGSAGHG